MAFLLPPLPSSTLPIPPRPSRAPVANLGGPRLPRTAYTTLSPDDTPLCRVITNMYRTRGQYGHTPTVSEVTNSIHAAVDAGFSTFDLSYGGGDAELYAREYVKSVGRASLDHVQFCTKLVLDPSYLEGRVTRNVVEAYVDRALKRMAVERIHLFQLQWGDYRDERFVDVLGYLEEMRVRGKVRSVGTVNFPTRQLRYVKQQRLRVASNQVSFSLLDRRPDVEMLDWCRENCIGVLAYDGLGSMFFSERYLGMPEPSRKAFARMGAGSGLFFHGLIRVWGGWSLFQELLYAIKCVADKYGVSMENVAVRWMLEREDLSAVVVGARIGIGREIEGVLRNVRAFEFELDDEDRSVLDDVVIKGNDMYRILGDSGCEFQNNRQGERLAE